MAGMAVAREGEFGAASARDIPAGCAAGATVEWGREAAKVHNMINSGCQVITGEASVAIVHRN